MTKSVWLGVLGFVLTLTVLQGVEAGLVVTVALSVLAALNFRRRGGWFTRLLATAIVLGMAGWLFWANPWLFAIVAGVIALWVVRHARRMFRAGPGAWRHVPRMVWCASRWRWFSRGQGVGWHDRHRRRLLRFRLPGATHADQADDRRDFSRVQFPRARWRVTPHGIEATVRAIPKVGRSELEQAASYLADHWRVHRVTVSQPKPGVYVLHGMVRDPLTAPLGPADAPPGTYDGTFAAPRLWLGRTESGADLFLELANVSGVVMAGLPGAGKSVEISSFLMQLCPSRAVQLVTLDGKGGSEFEEFDARCWLSGGSSLDKAAAILEELVALMEARLACVRQVTGRKNIWSTGISASWPLIVTIIDECQRYLDLAAVKGDRDAEKLVARCIALVADLMRRGRSVGFLTVAATQKATTDACPSAVRDNAAVAIAFALKTTDAAVAILGPDVREFPAYSPVALRDRSYAGCAVATIASGRDPFTRFRAPLVDEHQAAKVADTSAGLRRDPRDLLPVAVPDDASALVDS